MFDLEAISTLLLSRGGLDASAVVTVLGVVELLLQIHLVKIDSF